MSAGDWLAWAVLSLGNAGLLGFAVWLRVSDRRTIESVRAGLRARGAVDSDCTCIPTRLHDARCPVVCPDPDNTCEYCGLRFDDNGDCGWCAVPDWAKNDFADP